MMQQNVGITAGGFYYVDYKSYGEILNMIYSYFTILQTLFDQKI
jgi:hypothetical protein